jgi:5-carboxymethyl-2-hydroxymuconate isomerase
MPHITLEYTDNLEFDVPSLLADLHEALVSTGAVAMKGIKSRAICHTQYRIADGYAGYAFVHVGLLIREGRPLETQQAMVRQVMEVLSNVFRQRYEDGYLSLSADLKEMKSGTSMTKHNIPASGVPDG